MRAFDTPGWDTNGLKIQSSRQILVSTLFTDLVKMEGLVGFCNTNIQILAEPGIKPRILWLEGKDRDLTNCNDLPNKKITSKIKKFNFDQA